MPEYVDLGLLRKALRGVWTAPNCPEDIADYIMHVVDLLPVEKATKIVRCEDCIHWDKRTTNKNGFDICPASSMEIHERDYCSYGERKGGLRMPDELKPCPFCGSENVAFILDYEQQMENTETGFIWCHGCGFSSDSYYNLAKAIEAWNRRADDE